MSRSANPERADDRSRRRRRGRVIIAAGVLSEAIPLWLRGYGVGGDVVVRCRDGHLFTTLWIPGASVKALRLGGWRLQHCPVGHHWTIVAPVRRSDLSRREARAAGARKDIRIP